MSDASSASAVETVREGAPAPDFTLPSQTGESVTLSDHRGKSVSYTHLTLPTNREV